MTDANVSFVAHCYFLQVIFEHCTIFLVYIIKAWIPDIAGGTMRRQFQIRNKLEYLHRTIRYKQFYTDINEVAIDKNEKGEDLFLDHRGNKVKKLKKSTALDPLCDPMSDCFSADGNCLVCFILLLCVMCNNLFRQKLKWLPCTWSSCFLLRSRWRRNTMTICSR